MTATKICEQYLDNVPGLTVTKTDSEGRVHVEINGKKYGHFRATKKGISWRAKHDGKNWSTISSITSVDEIISIINGTTAPPKPAPKPPQPVSDSALVPPEFNYFSRKCVGNKTDVEVFETLMEQNRNVLLTGATGSGKTTLVRHFCAKHKLPYKRVSLNGGATVEDLVGHYILKNNETVWVDGILTSAVKNGWVLAIDEINSAPAEILFVLNSLTDNERVLILSSKDGETITPHPNFRCVATCNPSDEGYAGVNELNEALKDRFVSIIIDYNDKVEERILKEMELSSEVRDDIMKFTKYVRESYAKGELITPWSTRSIKTLANFIQMDMTDLIQNRFTSGERTVVLDLLDVFIHKKKDITSDDDEGDF